MESLSLKLWALKCVLHVFITQILAISQGTTSSPDCDTANAKVSNYPKGHWCWFVAGLLWDSRQPDAALLRPPLSFNRRNLPVFEKANVLLFIPFSRCNAAAPNQ